MADEMYLIRINSKAMDYIWKQCPKEVKDEVEYVVYEKDDIPYLYYSGLVDTDTYSLEEWEQAFQDVLGEDGRYWVRYEKMIWLGKYRYHRVVTEPFDPLKIRTGRYRVDRFWKLIENSVVPSTSLPKHFLKNVFDNIVRQGKSPEDIFAKDIAKAKQEAAEKGEELHVDFSKASKIFEEGGIKYVEITRENLLAIKDLIDTYPSPQRKLQLGVHDLRVQKLQNLSDMSLKREKSNFEGGKDFRETTKKNLKDMLVKASEDKNAGRKPMGEEFDIASMQKQKRPPSKF